MHLESANLKKNTEELSLVKSWFLSKGARSLARYVHKGPKMRNALAAVNNAMSVVGINAGV
ncbi:hypothetical protein Hanom_Chr16g01441581 [Helianthus anomalus]